MFHVGSYTNIFRFDAPHTLKNESKKIKGNDVFAYFICTHYFLANQWCKHHLILSFQIWTLHQWLKPMKPSRSDLTQ